MFTKGKWEVGFKGYKGTPVVIVSDVVPIVIALLGQDGRIPKDEAKANAQLIASAPDLYEALTLVYSEPKRFTPSELAKIGKALAKADGK